MLGASGHLSPASKVMQTTGPATLAMGIVRKIGLAPIVFGALAIVAALLVPHIPWRTILTGTPFQFLLEPTGWDIPYAVVTYTSRDTYARAIFVGVCNTLLAGVLAIVCATIVGFAVGLAAATGNIILSGLARLYVDVIRNIPLIIQAMFWYTTVLHLPSPRGAHELFGVFLSNRGLFLPKPEDPSVAALVVVLVLAAAWALFQVWKARREGDRTYRPGIAEAIVIAALAVLAWWGVSPAAVVDALSLDWPALAGLNFRGGLRLPLELAALVVAVTIYRGAFLAEIFRAGFRAVLPGQIDAARSLGLSPLVTLIKIRIPLALVSIMPPLASEYMVILKVTSIGIVVGYTDIYAVASSTASLTGRSIEVVSVMVLAYLLINYTIAIAMDAANQRFQIPGRGPNG
jgi:general L-amino acid transport system permease protein